MRSRAGEAGEEGERDPAVDIGEDRGGAGPEALEEAAELVGQTDAAGDEVVAAAHERAQGLDLVGDGRERPEAMAVRAQDVGEHVGVAGIGLRCGGPVARAASLHDVGVDRHDGKACREQRLDDEAGGALDRDGQRLGGRDPLQPGEQLGEAGGVMLHLDARNDIAPLVDDADGMAVRAPVEADKEGHGRNLRVRVGLARAGRSCGSLIDWRSRWRASARHPVVRSVLPAPAARRVSRWPSRGKPTWPSRRTLGRAKATPLRGSASARPEVAQ